MADEIIKNVVDNYKEHSQHRTYDKNCSECFKWGKECEYGHECDSRCMNDEGCPCCDDHWCSMNEHSGADCEFECNNHKNDAPEPQELDRSDDDYDQAVDRGLI